ncbi:hypothetical protein [Neobacillus niacini]|uniref:hypothetical protein n=1 Tax=Neobacillus niacini TaxID=86668 RepID=UPI001C8DC968|nr:hypothetical protein [Neobacillus niacini]MBY0146412.1 hypothetical protein [Neobacillus niacini]
MLDKIKGLFKNENIRIELDDWYKWYKEPKVCNDAVVAKLQKEGIEVKTISITDNVTSNKISTLLIDGIQYELTVTNPPYGAPAQVFILKKNSHQ